MRSFYPPSVNSAFYFIAKVCIQASVNRTQPNFAKWIKVIALTICLEKLGVIQPDTNCGSKRCIHYIWSYLQ